MNTANRSVNHEDEYRELHEMRNANESKYKMNNGMDQGLNKTVLKLAKFKLDCPVIKSIPRKNKR